MFLYKHTDLSGSNFHNLQTNPMSLAKKTLYRIMKFGESSLSCCPLLHLLMAELQIKINMYVYIHIYTYIYIYIYIYVCIQYIFS